MTEPPTAGIVNRAMESSPIKTPSQRSHRSAHRTVIVGHDGSESGVDALRLGRVLSEALGAALLVARIIEANGSRLRSDLGDADERAAIDVLGTFGTRAVELVANSVAEGLLTLAGTIDPIAIVVGAGRALRTGRASQTAEALARKGSVPIAVAPHGYARRKDARLLDVAAAFDGSNESWPAVSTAIHIAASTHGILTILTADDVAEPTAGTPWSKLTAGAFEAEARRSRSQSLQAALAVTPSSLPTQGWLLHGRAAGVLAEASDQFDLLVTGSRGHGPTRSALFGSTTRDLALKSRCPLLVVPKNGGPNPLGAGWPIGPGVLRRDLFTELDREREREPVSR